MLAYRFQTKIEQVDWNAAWTKYTVRGGQLHTLWSLWKELCSREINGEQPINRHAESEKNKSNNRMRFAHFKVKCACMARQKQNDTYSYSALLLRRSKSLKPALQFRLQHSQHCRRTKNAFSRLQASGGTTRTTKSAHTNAN